MESFDELNGELGLELVCLLFEEEVIRYLASMGV